MIKMQRTHKQFKYLRSHITNVRTELGTKSFFRKTEGLLTLIKKRKKF